MQFPQSTAAILKREWRGLCVEYGQLDAVGEFDFAMPKQGMSVAFVPHEQVTWSVGGGARQTTVLPAGSVFLYGEDEFVWHRRSRPSEYINLLVDPSLLRQLLTEHGLSADTELEQKVIFQDTTILHVAQLLKTEILSGGLAGDLYVESLRNVLAVHLLRHYVRSPIWGAIRHTAPNPTTNANPLDGLKLHQLKEYIEKHLSEELTIATLADQVPMSQFHFARAFKAATGEPPHRYINQRRIERAKILLSLKQLSVAEIAYQTGFSNQSHFTAQFRKNVGMTPKQFRTAL